MSVVILLHCGQWLLSSSPGVLILKSGNTLLALLELKWSFLLGCYGELYRGVVSYFVTYYSSQILVWLLLSTVRPSSQVTSGGSTLFVAEGLLPKCDVLVVSYFW